MGKSVSAHPDYVRLISYVVLFSPDFLEIKEASPSTAEAMEAATSTAVVAAASSSSSSSSSPSPSPSPPIPGGSAAARDARKKVEEVQEMLLNMLKRFIYSQHPRPAAVTVFANILVRDLFINVLRYIYESWISRVDKSSR